MVYTTRGSPGTLHLNKAVLSRLSTTVRLSRLACLVSISAALITLSGLSSPVLDVMFRQTRLLSVLSLLYSPGGPVSVVLLRCQVLAVLFSLFSPGVLIRLFSVLLLSCSICPDMPGPGCPVLAVVSDCPLTNVLRHLSDSDILCWPRCLALAVLYWLSCSNCSVLAILSQLFCLGHPVAWVLFWLSCPSYSVHTVSIGRPVMPFMSRLS
jgi:hypothetical protein